MSTVGAMNDQTVHIDLKSSRSVVQKIDHFTFTLYQFHSLTTGDGQIKLYDMKLEFFKYLV